MVKSDVDFCDTVKNWLTFVPAEECTSQYEKLILTVHSKHL